MKYRKVRFSKASLKDHLLEWLIEIEKEHAFDYGNGYNQVIDKGEELNRLYGEWSTLLRVMEHIEDGWYEKID